MIWRDWYNQGKLTSGVAHLRYGKTSRGGSETGFLWKWLLFVLKLIHRNPVSCPLAINYL